MIHRLNMLALFPLAAVVLVSVCSSSSKMLKHRQYDAAIARSVKELMDDPADRKEIGVLAKAYALAEDLDNDRVKYLKQSKEPQVWEEVFTIYSRLKNRQDLVRPLDPSVLQAINFTEVDYDQEIIDSKKKAADFLFAKGKALLAKKTRFDAREAYECFTRVKELLPAYPGIDDRINEAYGKGFAYVYLKIQNTSRKALPRAFEEDLVKIALPDDVRRWLAFDSRFDPKTRYDYAIILNIRTIEVSPELAASADFTETKEVENGWEYVLDAKGNVTKDSLGNDVKRTKYATLKCYVTKFSLGKTAKVAGTLDFLNAPSGQMIKTDPIAAESKFEYAYALVKGEKEAMSEETKKMTSLKIVPFPSNEELIFQTSETLKDFMIRIIKANLRLLE
ncbi:MAG: hypothetical protein JW699_03355 [Chitinispirillaceae bacterium]|nr:hypothetical protein [Chitinispirillaceae bacterium]